MEAGDFMRIAIGVFFLIFGVGIAYGCYRLGAVLGRLTDILKDAGAEVTPLLTRVETTLDGVNAELGHVEHITGSAGKVGDVAESAVTGVYGAVSKPVQKAAGAASAAKASVSSFISGRRKEA